MVRSHVEYTLQEDGPAAAPLAFKAFVFRIGVVIALMYAGAKLVSVDAKGNVLMESSTSNVSDSICVRLPIRSDDCLPAVAKGATAGFLTGLFLVPTFFIALCICGFGLCGIIKGSCAAACQTPSTDAGSCFACCQSLVEISSKEQAVAFCVLHRGHTFDGARLDDRRGAGDGCKRLGDAQQAVHIAEFLDRRLTRLK